MEVPKKGSRTPHWQHRNRRYGDKVDQIYHITDEYVIIVGSFGVHVWKLITAIDYSTWELKKIHKSIDDWMGV